MKKIILSIITAVTLLSCSPDEITTEPVVEETVVIPDDQTSTNQNQWVSNSKIYKTLNITSKVTGASEDKLKYEIYVGPRLHPTLISIKKDIILKYDVTSSNFITYMKIVYTVKCDTPIGCDLIINGQTVVYSSTSKSKIKTLEYEFTI